MTKCDRCGKEIKPDEAYLVRDVLGKFCSICKVKLEAGIDTKECHEEINMDGIGGG